MFGASPPFFGARPRGPSSSGSAFSGGLLAAEGIKKELLRKTFHCLSLLYLWAYHELGLWTTLRFLAGFLVIEGSVEALRLKSSRINIALMRFFGGIHREKEAARLTGIWWTALGCWITLYFFGAHRRIVDAALLYLALGDSAAALVGKFLGRVVFSVGGRRKSLEGSLVCLAVCLVCGRIAGLKGAVIWAGALSATIVELLPVPFDDNLWLPIVSGLVLYWLR